MQVHRLRLLNFRQHEDTDLAFDLGLTGIIGPNGTGKTTLLEALAWAIYGTKAARGTVASIRRRNAPPRARVEVELEFSLGPHRYRVVRHLHGAELYQDGDPSPIANSATAVTDRLTRILGMSRDEFFNTYFTGQKELAIMGAMTAGERAQFLSRVLGYERLRTAQARLRDERTGLRARLQEVEARLVSPGQLAEEEAAAAGRLEAAAAASTRLAEAVAAAVDRLNTVRPEWERLQALRERVRSLESDLRVADQGVVNAREAHQALDRDLAEALTARTRQTELAAPLAELPGLTEELAGHEARARELARWREQTGQVREVERRLAAIAEQLTALPGPDRLAQDRQEMERVTTALAEVDATAQRLRTEWDRDQQDARSQRKQRMDQYQDFKVQRDRLLEAGPDGDCPTCGRPLGDSYRGVMEELERQLAEVTVSGKFYAARIKELERAPEALREAEARRAALRATVTRLTEQVGRAEGVEQNRQALLGDREAHQARLAELQAALAGRAAEYDEARHQAARERLAALEPLRLESERLGAVAARAERLTAEAARAEAELTRQEARLAELRQALVEAGWSEEAFTEAGRAVEAADRARWDAERALVEAQAEARLAEADRQAVARRREERDRGEAEAARLGLELLLSQELHEAFNELRGDLNDTMRPDLSDLGSRFLRDLSMGRYTEFELDEDYTPVIVEDGEPQRVLSGGEEDIVSLALRLAISQMIAERAGQPLSLLILDEVFGSLDEERRLAVLDLLRLVADRFPQVVLITHIEAVREGFDRVVRLEYDVERGVARVREDDRGHDAAA